MQAEIIAIGDELTSGERLDTNSQWLSRELGDIGIRPLFHTTVADDMDANVLAFQQAASRVELILCTGGLGPTADDLTRQAIADAFRLPLELDASSLERIRTMFSSRGRDMPERNRVQAMFPRGAVPIWNPHGTAPGIDLTVGSDSSPCRIFSLPGVPAEMKDMWRDTVRPALAAQMGAQAQVVQHHQLKCFGAGESALEAMLPDLIRRGREPTVGITVSKATITLRVTARGKDDDACHQLIQPTAEIIRDCLGELVFGEGDDELHHAVARMLTARGETLAVAEWGTGGLIADWLSTLPQAAHVFRGGKVVTSLDSANTLLGVDVSFEPHEHARAMAVSVREQSGAEFGISLGAFPANPNDPEAKVFIGLATGGDSRVAGRRFAGHPDILKERAAKQALDLLRLHLLRS